MKHKIFIFAIAFSLTACKSNRHKAEDIETKMDKSARVSGTESVGLKKGEMMVMDKVAISEKLRDLQNSVYSLEDKVYGTRKLGTLGQYGDLKGCKRKLASRQYGGSGSLVWTEPLDRVTDKEEELKIGLDEKKELVGVSEEYLRDRLQRFQGYKSILQKRSDEFEERIEECKTELATKEMDVNQSSKVMVTEGSKAGVDKAALNKFMCTHVQNGASLRSLMLNALAKGWMSLNDLKMEQNLVGASLKDSKGSAKPNAMLFSGWKLAYDKGPVTVGELLEEDKDAQLTAWTYDNKAEVSDAGKCLHAGNGEWN